MKAANSHHHGPKPIFELLSLAVGESTAQILAKQGSARLKSATADEKCVLRTGNPRSMDDRCQIAGPRSAVIREKDDRIVWVDASERVPGLLIINM